MTKNIPRLKLSIIPKSINDAKDTASIIRNIENVTNIPYSKIESELYSGIESNDPSRPIILLDELTIEEAIIFDARFSKYKGVKIIQDVMRQYDQSSLFSIGI